MRRHASCLSKSDRRASSTPSNYCTRHEEWSISLGFDRRECSAGNMEMIYVQGSPIENVGASRARLDDTSPGRIPDDAGGRDRCMAGLLVWAYFTESGHDVMSESVSDI